MIFKQHYLTKHLDVSTGAASTVEALTATDGALPTSKECEPSTSKECRPSTSTECAPSTPEQNVPPFYGFFSSALFPFRTINVEEQEESERFRREIEGVSSINLAGNSYTCFICHLQEI